MTIEHYPLLIAALAAGAAVWLLIGRRRGTWTKLAAALSVMLVVAAMAGVRVQGRSALRVFVVDFSASMRGEGTRIIAGIRGACGDLRPNDRVGVVAFGRNAEVLLPPTRLADVPAELPPPGSIDRNATSVEQGLDAALAMFGSDGKGDIVLVTDGKATAGDAARAAGRIAGRNIRVHSLTLAARQAADAWVDSIQAPSSVAAGEAVDVEIWIGANQAMHGKLVLLMDEQEAAPPEPVDVSSPRMALVRRVMPRTAGLHVVTARLLSPGDEVSENNEVSRAVRVRGPLQVGIITSKPAGLAEAILKRDTNVDVRRVAPEGLGRNEAILRYDAIVIDDVSAARLGGECMDWLRRFVTDAGRGLIVLGGPSSFGPGGYARTPIDELLPVDPDPEQRAAEPTNVVIVADRSGSMAERVGDRQKIDFVREALLRAGGQYDIASPKKGDQLSIVAFNDAPEELLTRVEPGTPEGQAALQAATAKIFPSGRTNIPLALRRAEQVLGGGGTKRYVILISDGMSQEPVDAAQVVAEMRAAGSVLSVVAPSEAMNDGLEALKKAAAELQGRFITLKNISELPAALERETRAVNESLVKTGEFSLAAGDGVPAETAKAKIAGYVLTAARKDAPPMLRTGDAPIVAKWRRGLGRVAAVTTSLDLWAADWEKQNEPFVLGLMRWAAAGDAGSGLTVELTATGDEISVAAEAAQPLDRAELAAKVLTPRGTVDATLRRTGLRRYEGSAPRAGNGLYIATVLDGGVIAGEGQLTLSYSDEWREGVPADMAQRASDMTGGTVLRSLDALPPLAEGRSGEGRSIASILLGCAAVLFVGATLAEFRRKSQRR